MLTDQIIADTQPKASKFYLWDDRVIGLGVQVLPSGKKSFFLQWRDPAAPNTSYRRKIAAVDEIVVSDAREIARQIKACLSGGSDPVEGADEADDDEPSAINLTTTEIYEWLNGHKRFRRGGALDDSDPMRAQIVDAASALFLEQGYDISMDAVAARAGLSKPTIYRYFTDKDALFQTAVGHVIRDSIPMHMIDHQNDVRTTLLNFARIFRGKLLNERSMALYRLTAGDMQKYPDLLHWAHEVGTANLINMVTAYFERIVKSGHARKIEPLIAAECFLAAVVGLERTRQLLGVRFFQGPLERQYLEAIVDMFLVTPTPDTAAATDMRSTKAKPRRRRNAAG